MSFLTAVRTLIPGVSWQNPLIGAVLKVADPIDYLIRLPKGLRHFPAYSIRARAGGIRTEFGGGNFSRHGKIVVGMLQKHAYLKSDSKVLEIGCGCGREALALTRFLDNGTFTGMDIERICLEACLANDALTSKGFKFDLLDVQNNEYNPNGRYLASEYTFPYPEHSFDVIFHFSVFTHMKTRDVRNYIKETCRLLKKGHTTIFSALLMDRGARFQEMTFPYKDEEHHYFKIELPEVAIGYQSAFFQEEFGRYGLKMVGEPVWGSWREGSTSHFPQDVLVFR